MKPLDYYKMLGVTRKSSIEEIKVNYRKLAKTNHPDANTSDPSAEDRFKDLNSAYNTLADKEKKRKYDKLTIKYGYGVIPKELIKVREVFGKDKNSMNEIIEILKHIGKGAKDAVITTADEIKEKVDEMKEPKKGMDIEATLEISLEEGLRGTEKKISITSLNKTNNYTVDVPKGIKEGEKIRLAALGKPGKNGGKPGDLIIFVKIKEYKGYKVSGNNLLTNIDISYAQSIVGDVIHMKVLGEQVDVNIKPNTPNNSTIVINKKGYTSSMGRGDLIITVFVKAKEEITERERKIYAQLLRVEKQLVKEK